MKVVRQQTGSVVPIAATKEGRPSSLPRIHNAGGIPVAHEISSCQDISLIGIDSPTQQLVHGQTYGGRREVQDVHDDGVIDEGKMGHLFAVQFLKNRQRLNSRHDPGPSHGEGDFSGLRRSHGFQPIQILSHNMLPLIGLLPDHSVQVRQIKMMAIGHHIQRARKFNVSSWLQSKHLTDDGFAKCFGFSGKSIHADPQSTKDEPSDRSTKWLASLPANPAGIILRNPPNRLRR